MRSVLYIGFDPRPAEVQAFAVARYSIERWLSSILPMRGLVLSELRAKGFYTREHEVRWEDGNRRTYDVISGKPMSTEFSLSRFLVPYLASDGYAMFVDADVMGRANLHQAFNAAMKDSSKACWVVKHDHKPTTTTKMDGQIQTSYERKNWSSVVIWNCDHPGAKYLTPEVVNRENGLWLHQFTWLDDKDIGELDPRWNWLVGHSDPEIDPALVHFTDGVPSMEGYSNVPFASEWFENCARWAL